MEWKKAIHRNADLGVVTSDISKQIHTSASMIYSLNIRLRQAPSVDKLQAEVYLGRPHREGFLVKKIKYKNL